MKSIVILLATLTLLGCSPASTPSPTPTQASVPIPSPTPARTPVAVSAPSGPTETATFAGGCFWAMQTEFEKLKGVDNVTAGYSGGTVPNPTYEQVGSGRTGYAETVQITFEPSDISYEDLVRIFLLDIDPTTRDRQGNDTGTQYRSVIFYHGDTQQAVAQKVIAEIDASKRYRAPIVTQVVPFQAFYNAEGYHQNFFASHPSQMYCAAVVGPEVRRFVQMNQARLKPGS